MTLTLAATYLVLRSSRARDELRFQTTADEMRHVVEIRMHTYVELLRAGVALFGASQDVSAREFHQFVEHLRLNERYPGIQGIGFARRLTPEEAAAAQVWPPGERDEYTQIVYLEPADERNGRALGYDMFSEPVRRAAMERARDTGEPSASGKVTLVQEGPEEPEQPGFLIYAPVYRNEAPTASVEERRAALMGYVYSPFRMVDLFSGILDRQSLAAVAFEVHDGEPGPSALLFAHEARLPGGPHEPLTAAHTIDIAGREWTLRFRGAQHAGDTSPIWLAPAVLGFGLSLSLALFAIMLGQYRGREAAERHAAALRSSEEALRESDARLRRVVVLEREARAEAQAADRAKDEFLATLSHELRTPLNAILGWITMLRSGRVRDERRTGALEVIERNARAQARLIEDLLDVSRIITGKVRIELHPLHVGPIVQTAVEALRPGAEAKGVHLHASIDPTAGLVLGDGARLQQVAWNLLSNAIKFTPAGGAVHLDVVGGPTEVELRVRDTGVGIRPDFLPHVFERFRQADSSTTRAHSGVGLGLAIVRHLVELHGGRIAAYSEGEGRGALFVVSLPLAQLDAASQVGTGAARRVDLDGMRVLVVDDDDDTRDLLHESLTASGARVATARSADEALSILARDGADVLVSDIGMPGRDGLALIRDVQALPGGTGRVPAIALTAYAGPDDRERVVEAGYRLHLSKPVDLEALHEALGRLRPAASP